jgi:hypothetical protein
MLFIYDYFMHNRLYCNIKFYRVTHIKGFIDIRKYKSSPLFSLEHKIYSNFVINWIKYDNPLKYLLWLNIYYIDSIPITGKDTVHNINRHIYIYAFSLRTKYGSGICTI